MARGGGRGGFRRRVRVADSRFGFAYLEGAGRLLARRRVGARRSRVRGVSRRQGGEAVKGVSAGWVGARVVVGLGRGRSSEWRSGPGGHFFGVRSSRDSTSAVT